MKIGITGINGFIGNAVSKALLDHGHSITKLDKYTKEFQLPNMREIGPLDWILHFGANTSIMDSFEDPGGTIQNNLWSTMQALSLAEKSNAKFIYLSSYIYGQPKYIPVDEEHEINTTNPYMASKYLGEVLSQQFCEHCKIPLIILRAFNIYGFNNKTGRLISDLFSAFIKHELFTLHDPKPRRDYLYIKDFIALIIAITNKTKAHEGIFNVGFGKSYSNLEVVNLFNSLTENALEIALKNQIRTNDIQNCVVDNSKVCTAYSWQPHYSLYDGISEMIHEIQGNRS